MFVCLVFCISAARFRSDNWQDLSLLILIVSLCSALSYTLAGPASALSSPSAAEALVTVAQAPSLVALTISTVGHAPVGSTGPPSSRASSEMRSPVIFSFSF